MGNLAKKLFQTELTSFSDYEKYDATGIDPGNPHMGETYEQTLKTEFGGPLAGRRPTIETDALTNSQ